MSNGYGYEGNPKPATERSYVVTLLLGFFFGCLGVHRFYTGYVVIGIVQLLTAGGCGLWTLVDLISLALNKYQDAEGNDLGDYNAGCGLITLIFIVAGFIIGGLSALLG